MLLGADHARADVLGELDGEGRDTARPALDQDGLAGLELQRVLDGADRREAGQRHRRGVDMRQRRRLLGDDVGANSDLLAVGSVAAGLEHAEHLVADLEVAHAFTDGADFARKIASQDERELGPLVFAGGYLPIGAVDARGHDVDHDLPRPRDRIGQIAIFQDLRSAELLDVRSLHGVSSWVFLEREANLFPSAGSPTI